MFRRTYFLVFVFLCSIYTVTAKLSYANPNEYKGVILLDTLTFSKIIPSNRHATVVFVYQKGQLGDYGTDSIRHDYYSFADEVNAGDESEKVLFTQVVVNGAANLNLVRLMGGEDKFKDPMMFVFPKGSSSAIRYPPKLPYHMDSLRRFLEKHTDANLKILGTLTAFNDIVNQYVKANPSEGALLIGEAERVVAALPEGEEREWGEYYVKVLKKLQLIGPAHLQKEISRLTTILNESKVSAKTKRNVQSHVNVLAHFQSGFRRDEEFVTSEL